MKRHAGMMLTIAAWCGITGSAMGAAFTGGNIVVSQFGDGAGTLDNAGQKVFLNEYTTGGTLAQQLAMPTTTGGGNYRFVNSGSASSEGALTLSANGQYLTLGGYDAAVGTASVSSTANIGRVVGRVDLNGNIDTSTRFTDGHITNNFRGVVSNDGTQFWTAGAGSSSSGGTRYLASLGATTSTQVSATVTNTRVANIFNGQLYTSSQSGANIGINAVGLGLPTSSGNTTTLLPGFSAQTGLSPYDFWFSDASTLYVADDGNISTGKGGLQKWTFSGSTWVLDYRITGGLTAGLRGLAGTTDGLGNAVLYGITADGANNKLVVVTDLGVSSTFNTIATAANNTIFRGVEIIPIPEPATLAFLLVGSAMFLHRRRSA